MINRTDLEIFLRDGIASGEISNDTKWGVCLKGDPLIFESLDKAKRSFDPNEFADAIRMIKTKYRIQGFSNVEIDKYSNFFSINKIVQDLLSCGDPSAIEIIRFASEKKKKKNKDWDYYSFATKLASFWNRSDFQIYDSLNNNFISACFGSNNLRDYEMWIKQTNRFVDLIGIKLGDRLDNDIIFDRKILDMYIQYKCKTGIFE